MTALSWKGARRAVVFGIPATLLLGAWSLSLRLNLTTSLPVGLYAVVPGPPTRGALVLACLPPRVAAFARSRGYVPSGDVCPGGILPVGTFIVASLGDTVTVTMGALLVNGAPVRNSRPHAVDRRGRPLLRLALGRYPVARDSVWILSPFSPWSFDSRYFGPVDVGAVRGRLLPLWIR